MKEIINKNYKEWLVYKTMDKKLEKPLFGITTHSNVDEYYMGLFLLQNELVSIQFMRKDNDKKPHFYDIHICI